MITTTSSIRVMPRCLCFVFTCQLPAGRPAAAAAGPAPSVHARLAPEGPDRGEADADAAVLEADEADRVGPALGADAVHRVLRAREEPDHFRRDAALGEFGVTVVGRVR